MLWYCVVDESVCEEAEADEEEETVGAGGGGDSMQNQLESDGRMEADRDMTIAGE